MGRYIEVDSLWTCETCFHCKNGKCTTWCDSYESYRPAYNKLTIIDGELTASENKLWCEEYHDYYGNSHPLYGGTLTDLRKLPVGTKFFVANGWGEGEVLSDNRILVHSPTGDVVDELTDDNHSLYLK